MVWKRSAPAAGGGGGNVPTWVDELDTAPGGTSIDEFDDDSFSGWTTLTVTGGQTISEDKDLLSVQPTSAIASGDANAILQAHALNIGDAVEIAIVGHMQGANYMMFGPIISDGTAAGSAMVWMADLTNVAANVAVYPSGASGTFTATGLSAGVAYFVWGAIVYMRLEYDAANSFKTWLSTDGVSWFQTHTIARTITPSHVGFGFGTNGQAIDGQSVGIDYVRVVTV